MNDDLYFDLPIGDTQICVVEWWYTDPLNPYRWTDHWFELTAGEGPLRFGDKFPMVREQ